MKKGWEVKKLADVCKVEYGTRVVNKRDGGSKYPVYGGGGATFYMDEYNREDQLVVARFAISEQCTRFIKGKFYLNDSGLTVSSKNIAEIQQDYLEYLLFSLNDIIYSLSRGTAQKNLDVPAFRNLPVSYPKSIPEQKRIVAVLDESFAALVKAKENAEKNLENARELFETYLQGVFEKEIWERKRIQDVAKIINGFAFSSKDFKPTNTVKSIKITNVGVKEFVEETDNYLPDKFIETLKDYKVREGNIVIALTRTIISAGLKVAIVPKSYDGALVNQRVAALVPNEKLINQQYLYYYLTTSGVAKYVIDHVNTLMQPNLSINDLKLMLVPCPSIKEQENIVTMLDDLRNETKKIGAIYQQKISDLEELKKSLLQKAFLGEL